MKILKTILISALLCGAAQAATVVQSTTFTAAINLAGSGSNSYTFGSGFSFQVNPFDSSLGTLESFTVEWAPTNVTITGVVNPTGGGGTINGGTGGTLGIGGQPYDSRGSSGTAQGGSNATLNASFVQAANSRTFTVAGAGINYNPAFLGFVQGSTPFAVAWDGSIGYGHGNLSSGYIGISSPLTVTYTYTPVPEPSAALLGGLGALALLRRRKR